MAAMNRRPSPRSIFGATQFGERSVNARSPNGGRSLSSGIVQVTDASRRSGDDAGRLLSMCEGLTSTTGSLRVQVEQFLERVRTG